MARKRPVFDLVFYNSSNGKYRSFRNVVCFTVYLTEYIVEYVDEKTNIVNSFPLDRDIWTIVAVNDCEDQ